MVGGSLIDGDVKVMLGIVCVDRRQEFLLCERVILVRHTQIPKDIFISGFWHELVSGQLHVVVIRPYRYDFKLTGRAVEIDFKIICAVLFLAKSGKFASFLKGDSFHKTADFVIVGVKWKAVVSEVVNGEGISVFACLDLTAHTADYTCAPGVYVGKRIGLIMVNTSVFVCIDFNIFRAAGQLQPGIAILFPVNISAAAYRVKTGIEFYVVCGVRIY